MATVTATRKLKTDLCNMIFLILAGSDSALYELPVRNWFRPF